MLRAELTAGNGGSTLATNRRTSGTQTVEGTESVSETEHGTGKHLSPADLAEREGVPLETVYLWNRKRTGPRYMKIGIHVRYRLADVTAW